MAECGNAECAYEHLFSQNGEKSIALVGEAVELQAVVLVKN